jgi:hypothetical protein
MKRSERLPEAQLRHLLVRSDAAGSVLQGLRDRVGVVADAADDAEACDDDATFLLGHGGLSVNIRVRCSKGGGVINAIRRPRHALPGSLACLELGLGRAAVGP